MAGSGFARDTALGAGSKPVDSDKDDRPFGRYVTASEQAAGKGMWSTLAAEAPPASGSLVLNIRLLWVLRP